MRYYCAISNALFTSYGVSFSPHWCELGLWSAVVAYFICTNKVLSVWKKRFELDRKRIGGKESCLTHSLMQQF